MHSEKRTVFNKYVGVGNFKVLAFNPTREQLNKMLGSDVEEEIEYTKEDCEIKIGEESIFCKAVFVDAWLEEQVTKTKHKIRFTIYDTPRLTKNGEKYQYINQVGQSSWTDEPENLPEFFTHFKVKENDGSFSFVKKDFRKAYRGEEQLIKFLVAWLELSPFMQKNTIFVEDTKRFWKGDMTELNALINDFEDTTVMALMGIRLKEDGTETKEYQAYSQVAFCPGRFYKIFRSLYVNKEDKAEALEDISRDKKLYSLNKFIVDNSDTENGFKDFYLMDEIQVYNPEMNTLTKEDALLEEDSSRY